MTGGGKGLYATGIMWCPGISALITMKILKRDFANLGWKWGKTRYQVWSYIIPILYALVAYLIIWVFGWGGFYNKKFVDGLRGESVSGLAILHYIFTPMYLDGPGRIAKLHSF
jgi:hypothetical protein